MSSYVYQSRSIQPADSTDAELLAQRLLDALDGNPVIRKFEIQVAIPDDDEDYYAIDICGTVDANFRDRLAGLTAFASANEAWLDALEECGLERVTMRSRMDVQ